MSGIPDDTAASKRRRNVCRGHFRPPGQTWPQNWPACHDTRWIMNICEHPLSATRERLFQFFLVLLVLLAQVFFSFFDQDQPVWRFQIWNQLWQLLETNGNNYILETITTRSNTKHFHNTLDMFGWFFTLPNCSPPRRRFRCSEIAPRTHRIFPEWHWTVSFHRFFSALFISFPWL